MIKYHSPGARASAFGALRLFPERREVPFRNFADKAERIHYAMEAYRLAVEAGWPKVEASLRDY